MAVELYTRIEDYLDGALGEQERLAFEAELRADPALASALATVRETRERLRRQWADESADDALLDTLKLLGAEHFQAARSADKKSGGARMFRLPQAWWAAAAATVAVLIAAWFFLRPPAHERLYAEYREFPEADFTVRGADPSGRQLQDAAEAFNRRDYAAALPAFQNYLSSQPDDAEARLYEGLCYLEMKQYVAAAAVFQQLGTTPNAWADEANWFLALGYLRQNKRPECVRALEGIRAESSRYQQAQTLLARLK